MKGEESKKDIPVKPSFPSKEELMYERGKMEKFIMDKLNNEVLTSEDILKRSKAFDSLMNEFMSRNHE